jgi:hypothetical protein
MDDWERHYRDGTSSQDYVDPDEAVRNDMRALGITTRFIKFFDRIERTTTILHSWIEKEKNTTQRRIPRDYFSFILLIRDGNETPYFIKVIKINGTVQAYNTVTVSSSINTLDLGTTLNMNLFTFVFNNTEDPSIWIGDEESSNRDYILNRLNNFIQNNQNTQFVFDFVNGVVDGTPYLDAHGDPRIHGQLILPMYPSETYEDGNIVRNPDPPMAGRGYSDWIANLQALQSGKGFFDGFDANFYPVSLDTPTIDSMQELRDLKARQAQGLLGSGFGNKDTQLFEGMLGGGMEEMGLDGMEGEGVVDWLQNLYNVITKPKEALSEMPKRIWEFQDQYGDWTVTSWEVCREPLSSGLTKFIDLASRGQLLKNKERMKYDDIFHLYSNIYLKDSKTGKTKELRLEKNQRVNIFPIVPYKKGGKCMSVPNIPSNLLFRTVINKDTDKTTWEYSADRFNCQDFTKKRLEAVGLLTEPLRQFVMQDIQELLPNAKIQIQIAKGVTNAASIIENVLQGGMMCNCGEKCGCK